MNRLLLWRHIRPVYSSIDVLLVLLDDTHLFCREPYGLMLIGLVVLLMKIKLPFVDLSLEHALRNVKRPPMDLIPT